MKRAKKHKPASHVDLLAEKEKVNKLARTARLAINVIAGVLALFFTWVKLSGTSMLPVLASTEPEVLAKVILVFYYLCWVFGTGFDVGNQQAVYVSDPKEGRIALDTFGVLVALAIVTAALLWASDDIKVFAAMLVVFFIANILLWRYLLTRVRPIIEASAKIYREHKNYPDLERLHVVENYLAGDWQKQRFLAMCLLLAAANVICFVEPAQQALAAVVRLILPASLVPAIARLLPHLSIILFILVAEIWIWIMRVRTWTSLHVIAALRERYELRPRAGSH
jgi:hypothetical protein